MQVKYWGVRGSLPSANSPEQNVREFETLMKGFFQAGFSRSDQIREYLNSLSIPRVGGFGAATTCVLVQTPRQKIVLDAGSGLRHLSETEVKGPAGRGQAVIHLFFTHFHWDHILGLPFFAPLFIPGNEIHFYAVQPEMESLVRGVFKKPYFPVPFEALPSKINFHILRPREALQLEDLKITPYELDHPDACWGFRLESQGKSYAHCVDTEGTRVSRRALGLDLPLYQNADLMFFDAQYTLPELAEKANWGHSAAQIGLDLAFRENIKSVVFAHHDPGASTQQIYELQKQTEDYYQHRVKMARDSQVILPEVRWRFAYEGLEIEI